jgi:hypothetical protein
MNSDLELFMVELGDRLFTAADDLQARYDSCGTHIEFMVTQALRVMVSDEIPVSVNNIMEEKFELEDFDFQEWWELKRGIVPRSGKTKKPERLIVRVLRFLLHYFTK